MIGTEIASYRIASRIGAGGMGEVWLAEHAVLGRRVAIKFLLASVSQQAEMVERFFDEARAATRVADPGIVQIFDVGWYDGRAYIAMEYLDGESLSALLTRRLRLPVDVALRITQQIAITMAVAHGSGIIHRDLKPDNLIVVTDGAVPSGERIKILDFGIAKLLGDEQTHPGRTRTGAIMGTPMYMSPEQCRGAGEVDHRTDIYALGCVLYQLLTGRPPFLGGAPGDMIASHLLEAPAPPSTHVAVSPSVDALVMRCLAKNPDDRFAHMTDVARACAAASGSDLDASTITPMVSAIMRRRATTPASPIATQDTEIPEPTPPAVRARTRIWITAGVLALVMAAVIAWLATSTDDAASPAAATEPIDAAIQDVSERLDSAIVPDARVPVDAAVRRRPSDGRRYDPYEDP